MHWPTMAAAVVPRPPRCPTPGSSYPLCSCSLLCLIVACIRDGFNGHSFSSVDASRKFSQVIVVAVSIVTVVAVVAAPVSTRPRKTTITSTAASVVVVFAPTPPRAMAIHHVVLVLALSFSFSITVVQIFSLLAASPSAPYGSKNKKGCQKTTPHKNKKCIRRSLKNLFANVRVGMVNLLSGQRNHSLKGE